MFRLVHHLHHAGHKSGRHICLYILQKDEHYFKNAEKILTDESIINFYKFIDGLKDQDNQYINFLLILTLS